MKTKFENLNQLKTQICEGQFLFIENHILPEKSRVTKVVKKQSYFFTVQNLEGKESWIINGATELKKHSFIFKPDFERVDIFFKNDNKPYLSLYFNDTIIKGKS